tara:strand:- start:365 stop:685 length:321 start_codon:yes stop_codon:yes gene_type:complete
MSESNSEKATRLVHVNLAKEHLSKDVDAILQLTIAKCGSADIIIYGGELALAIAIAEIATSDKSADPMLGDVLVMAGETVRMIWYEGNTIEQCVEYWRENLPGEKR